MQILVKGQKRDESFGIKTLCCLICPRSSRFHWL